MNYRVIWNQQATEAVQRIYLHALDKEGVKHAVKRIGLELSARPLEAGESREGNARILFKHPLVVVFRVHERMKEVVISEVRLARK